MDADQSPATAPTATHRIGATAAVGAQRRYIERWGRFRGSPNFPALIVTIIVSICAALFAASYSLAFGSPTAHGVPVGVVGSAADLASIEKVLGGTDGTSLDLAPYNSRGAALTALGEQDILAVIVSTGPDTLDLYISSASGSSVARLLQADAVRWGSSRDLAVTVTDSHPLPASDAAGLSSFYVSLAAIITGFSGAVQLRVNAGGLSLARNLIWDLIRALVGGLLVTLTVGPLLQVAPLPLVPVWLVLSAAMLTAGHTYALFRVMFGAKWAMLPTWLLFVLLSNPSSGGPVASQLLPPFYEFVGRWLPTGVTVSAVRDLTYFPAHVHAEPFVVLVVWMVAVTVLYVVIRLRRFGSQVPTARGEK
ncbi:MAG: hypothetical protein JWQ43_3603 [Glaciihabitans sp.]|nr:hypothetical protein [Glaciihabitans sp.]